MRNGQKTFNKEDLLERVLDFSVKIIKLIGKLAKTSVGLKIGSQVEADELCAIYSKKVKKAKLNLSNVKSQLLNVKGLTLIELIIVIAVIAVLIVGFILILNPNEQFAKARDSRRKANLHQLRNALQDYQNEQGKYPLAQDNHQITGAGWGEEWLPYMKEVPKDPLSDRTYFYETDEQGKWFRLWAKIERCSDPDILGECGSDYNYSIISPNLSLAAFPTSTPLPTLSPTPTLTTEPTSTLTPGLGGILVFISTQQQPQPMRANIDPFDPAAGASQTVTLEIRDKTGNTITEVSVTVNTDSGSNTYSLTLVNGTTSEGNWAGTWTTNDSHDTIYNMEFTAKNSAGAISTSGVLLEGSLINLRAGL